MKKVTILSLTLLSVISLAACSTNKIKNKTKETKVENKAKTSDNSSEAKDNKTNENKENESLLFKGNYQEVLGEADFSNRKVEDGYHYGDLDNLERPTWATARITKADYDREKDEKREDIKVNPTGWPKTNPKVVIKHPDGSTYEGNFWNRSHMIADSLGGEPIKENLVTGSRPQNVGGRKNDGGMAYLEKKVRDYFKAGHKGPVDYSVENHYNVDNLLPDYTIVNAKSSDGKINEKVVVYNVANGWEINYKTAEVKEIK